MVHEWTYERVGEWTFRVAKGMPVHISRGSNITRDCYLAEAKKGEFVQAGNCITEPGDCWFEFGATPEEAVAKLKRELLH